MERAQVTDGEISAGADGREGNHPDLVKAYLDLLERALTFSLYDGTDGRIVVPRVIQDRVLNVLERRLGFTIVRHRNAAVRDEGGDWPVFAQTMIGRRRLASLRACAEQVLQDDVPGDLIEAGVWRGGSAIMMRAVLNAYGCTDRMVVVADSFEGFPPPRLAEHPEDQGIHWHKFKEVAIPEGEVRANFERYGLLDEQVQFVPGFFEDTMPSLAGGQWALVRLDADMYGSTMDCLTALYPGLSSGGYLIVDDYGNVPACRKAVDEYRREHGISEPIQWIDRNGVYWRRSSERSVADSAAQPE